MTNEFNKFDAQEMLLRAAEMLILSEGYDETRWESVKILNNASAEVSKLCLLQEIEFDLGFM